MQIPAEINENYLLEATAVLYKLIQRGGSAAQKDVKKELSNLNILFHLSEKAISKRLNKGIELLESIEFLIKASVKIKNQYDLTLTSTEDDFHNLIQHFTPEIVSQLNNNKNIKEIISENVDEGLLLNILMKHSDIPHNSISHVLSRSTYTPDAKNTLTKAQTILCLIRQNSDLKKTDLVHAAGTRWPDSMEGSFYGIIKSCLRKELIIENADGTFLLGAKGIDAISGIPNVRQTNLPIQGINTAQLLSNLNNTNTTADSPAPKKQRIMVDLTESPQSEFDVNNLASPPESRNRSEGARYNDNIQQFSKNNFTFK